MHWAVYMVTSSVSSVVNGILKLSDITSTATRVELMAPVFAAAMLEKTLLKSPSSLSL